MNKAPQPGIDESKMQALPGAAEIAARNSKPETEATASVIDSPPKVETMDSAPADKKESINAAKEALKGQHPSIDHLSAPASAINSGTATPVQQAEPETAQKSEAAESSEPAETKEIPTEPVTEAEKESVGEEGGVVGGETEVVDRETAAKGVEALQLGTGTKTQDQDAKEEQEAGTSVED